MTCCLNPACYNPPHTAGTNYCSNCGVPLVVLRNRYRPLKSLGGGGFGKTYLAEDIDKLNQKCVIKQFAPQIQGTNALQKATELFEQEARRLEQLGEHPQIPTLLAYFQEDSRLYLVQQFIDGQHLLTELEQQGTFSEAKIRALLQDLLAIIQIVHQQKVIHRDIKPENIIRRGIDGKLVLIDFGASKQINKTIVSQQNTNKGTSIGSFGYVPIEQMRAGEAYPASDLYSLGATCFHLLSGIHPWELWQTEAYGWVANWQQYIKTPISGELSRIIDKLLQQDYRYRYQSAAEVLQDLNRPSIPAKTTEISPPNLLPNHTPNFTPSINIEPKKSISITYFLLPLILLPLGAGAVYLYANSSNSNSTNKVIAENPNNNSNTPTKTAEPTYNNNLNTPSKTAETYNREGLEKYNKQDFSGAIADYTQAIAINPNYAEAYNNRGLAYYDSGDKRTAIADYTQAINLEPNYAEAYNNRGVAHIDLNDQQAALADYSQAIKINPRYALAYYNRGNVQSDLGYKQVAIADYTKSISYDPNYASAYYNRGNVYRDLGNNQAAIADYTQAVVINPNHANAYYNRGNAYADLGNKRAAIADYRQAADLYQQQKKEDYYQDALNRIQQLQ